MIRTLLIAVAAVGMLTGCYVKVNPQNVSSISDPDLCSAYRANKAKGWELTRDEIVRRGLLTRSDLSRIDDNMIWRGMSECGILALMGYPSPPSYCGKVNRSVGSWGVRKQWVYRPCGRYGSTRYIYSMNGKVTGWQD